MGKVTNIIFAVLHLIFRKLKTQFKTQYVEFLNSLAVVEHALHVPRVHVEDGEIY